MIVNQPNPVQVSIIVAARNERAAIEPFLASLFRQDFGDLKWEAWIADGMSDDGTRIILDQYAARHKNVYIVDNPGRIVSTGLNAAIRAAHGEIILRMDAHTTYAPDYCRRSVEALDSTGADNVGGPARTRAEGVVNRAIAGAYHSRFSTGGARFHDPSYEGWVDTVPYGCWRKATLISLGLFDESLVRNQDDELNLRIVKAGGKIWQDPAIQSWYSPRSRLSTLFRQYFQYGFWKVAVIRKHSTASWRSLVPSCFVVGNIAMASLVVAAVIAGWMSTLAVAGTIWLAQLTLYLGVTLVASIATARQIGWDTLLYVALAFTTFHVSYGLGFLAGLCRFGTGAGKPMPAESAWTRLSR